MPNRLLVHAATNGSALEGWIQNVPIGYCKKRGVYSKARKQGVSVVMMMSERGVVVLGERL